LKKRVEFADRQVLEVESKNRRGIATALAVGLAVLGGIWWLGIWWSPGIRSKFDLPNSRWWLDGLALADLVLFVGGHALVGWMLHRRKSNSQVFAAMTAGATLYALLDCVGMLRFHGSVLAVIAMSLASVASCSVVVLAGEQ
jgi:hypothetical protein